MTTAGRPSGPGDEGRPSASDGSPAPPSSRRRGRRALSMGTWLAIALLGVTITALVVRSAVELAQVSSLADEVFRERSRALLSLQADEVERYLQASRTRTATLAASDTVAEAARRFGAAFDELDELEQSVVDRDGDAVAAYYRTEVIPRLEEVTGEPIGLRRLLPTRGSGLYLQRHYVVPDPDTDVTVGERTDAGDGSTWSQVHADLHPVLSDMAAQLGFEDLLLIEPDSGTVIYTAGKATDFATSMQVGPYSGSVLAEGVREVRRQSEPGVVSTDVAPYGPDGGRPAGFTLAPVLDDGRLVAVLAAKVSLADIDQIMTVDRRWVDAGFGDTAETFLVASDGRMRSVARPFLEDRAAYLQAVADASSATRAERVAMAATGTTVPFQRAFADDELTSATSGDGTTTNLTDYLGRDVLVATEPVDVPGLDWLVATQVTAEQVAAPLERYRRTVVVAVAVVVLVFSFIAAWWARRTFRPLTALSERLRRLHEGRDSGPIPLRRGAPREFAALATSVETMIDSLERQRHEVDAAIAERRAMVRALLPTSVAARVDAGDRRVVEEIAHASVVVVTVGGLGRLVQRRDGADGRTLLDRLIRDLDPLAEQHGLERVKMLGDAYFAACGVNSPYLDHAPRAVAFARAAHETTERLTADADADVRLSIGVDSGAVTVGLTGSALLVFDMWGDTVTTAHVLAQRADPGETRISERTHALLPPDVPATRLDEPGAAVWRIAGPAMAEEHTP